MLRCGENAFSLKARIRGLPSQYILLGLEKRDQRVELSAVRPQTEINDGQ
jgi:hypothetical protein